MGRRPWFPWPYFIRILFFFSFIGTNTVYAEYYCREDQSSALLHLQQTLKFNPLQSSKLISWSTSTDCCSWKGVTCNSNGSIIGLDLKAEGIYGGLDNSSSLFNFQQLKNLTLAVNSFSSPIPASISRLVNLEHLDLSNSGFIGQVLPEISHLTKLLSLDLSCSFNGFLKLQRPNLTALVSNLSQLQVLRLDGINISYQGREWSNVLSSSLPNLRILSLSNCYLFGSPDVSLLRLKYLSEINIAANNFSAPFPEFFVHFANLESLILSYCEIHGKLPEKLFHLQSLVHLDISENPLLQGTLLDIPQNMSLQTLILSGTNMSGVLPYSIGSLHKLTVLDLYRCNFTGAIPYSVENLSHLQYLDLSYNMLNGSIPDFSQMMNLAELKLSHNSLVGVIPPSLFALPSIQKLLLSFNQFSGLLHEFPNAFSSPLATIDLSSNRLEGPIPLSIYNLQNLSFLDLSFNKFNGTVGVTNLQSSQMLTHLDLSYNNLSFSPSTNNFTELPPSISQLKLASCNLTVFPSLRNNKKMYNLDLSNNRIQGEIPNWIWNVGTVNLSHNLLSNLQDPLPDQNSISTSSSVVDLHSNKLTGPLPIVIYSASYIDYSYNNFNSTIPADIGNYLAFTLYFSLSHNELVGGLPESMCNGSYLRVLDLSYNSLDGEIPSCLFNMGKDLGVLNLSGNKLKGYIPESFSSYCALKTLDLNNNRFEGQVPRSLMNCTSLEVLNLGRNQINDKFPCWLTSFSNLRVLVLRSNKLHGSINRCQNTTNMWKSLQILDLAYNKISGDLPLEYGSSWKAMSDANQEEEDKVSHLLFDILSISKLYYIDKVAVISKGQQLELVKILTIFTSIDLSSNMFRGEIPSEIGRLTALYNLNLSNNALTGQIPSSIGNLKQLGSMDLSRNKLTGYIPKELERLTFLSFLNLSFNELKGAIPKGSQILTFTEESFQGNKDLCGYPVSVSCKDDKLSRSPAEDSLIPDGAEGKFFDSGVKIKWRDVIVSAEAGFFFGLGITVTPLLVCRRWHWQIDKILIRVFGMHPPPSSAIRWHRY